MYFDDQANLVQLNVKLSQKHKEHRKYIMLEEQPIPHKSNLLGKEVILNAQATFGWIETG